MLVPGSLVKPTALNVALCRNPDVISAFKPLKVVMAGETYLVVATTEGYVFLFGRAGLGWSCVEFFQRVT